MRRTGNEDNLQIADLTSGKAGFVPDQNLLVPEVARHLVGPRGTLLIVSDGMGGAAAGEVASAMAVSIVSDEMLRQISGGSSPVDALRNASNAANGSIWDKSQSDSAVRGLGATLTAAYLAGTDLFLSQVGDSRAYLVRGSQIRQLTEDQSWANAVKKAGIEVVNVPNNVILQALGTQANVNAEITSEQLQPDDILLLCSDGLSNKVTEEDIVSVLASSPSIEDASRNLIRLANERGGEDNITVVIARLEGGAGAERSTQHLGTALPGGMTVPGGPPKATTPLSAMTTSPNVPKMSGTAPLGASAPPASASPAPVAQSPAPPSPASLPPTAIQPARPAAQPAAPASQPPSGKSGSGGKIIVVLAVILLVPIFALALGAMFYVLKMRNTAASNPPNPGSTPSPAPKDGTGDGGTENPIGRNESIPDTMTRVEKAVKDVESMKKSLDSIPGAEEPKKKVRDMAEELKKLKTSLVRHRDGQSTSEDPSVETIGARAAAIIEEVKAMPSTFNLQEKLKSAGSAKRKPGDSDGDILDQAEKGVDKAHKEIQKAIPLGD